MYSKPLSAVVETTLPTERLRVAVLNRVFSPTGGGAERYSIALVEQLAARHEIHVYAQEIDHHWPGVQYHRISIPTRKPRWVNQLWYGLAVWWATRRGFDIVHSHENTWQGDVQTVHVVPIRHNLFIGCKGLRLAIRWLGVVTSPRLLAYLAMERSRFALRSGKKVVAISPFLRDLLGQVYPTCVPMLTVINPGVHLPCNPLPAPAARLALGLPLAGRLIAFVANDYGKKGLATLLMALVLLPPDVAVAVVGDPIYIKSFREQAMLLGVGGRVFFLGHLRDVSTLYHAVNAMAHPTLEDTFAMVVLEAMAVGLPVVVSGANYCGIAGLLQDGVNALILSSPTDSRELAEKLMLVLSDAALKKTLGDGARMFAESWSWPNVAARYETVYSEIQRASGSNACERVPT